MQRIVAVLGMEADLDIVIAPAARLQQFPHLEAEVTLHFEYEGAGAALGVGSPMREDLLGERDHAATCLARADGSEHGDAGEEPALRDHKPLRMLRRADGFRMVDLADDKAEAFALARLRVQGKR